MYTSFFNLREEPFRLTSDPRFFHLAQPHAAALTTVLEAVMRRKGFVVLTGPIGTGKTTIVHTTLQILTQKSASKQPISSAFILNPILTRDEFLEMILTEFEVPCTATSKPARLAALQRMLLDTQERGGTSVLLVDEAHLLSPELLEEIRLISNADTYKEKPLQIVLCGQPELLPLLSRPEMRALKQRIAASCSLRPLSLPELQTYIHERMRAAGFKGATDPFARDTVDCIFRLTQGVPRLVNLLCDSCLEMSCKATQPVIETRIVEKAAAELGINEVRVQEDLALPEANPKGTDAARDAVIGSALDVLINAMKRRQVPSQPLEQPPLNSTVSAGVPANGSNGKGASHDPVIESAVDLLIQAMKLRRPSTMEL